MRKVTYYIAYDETEFETKEECIVYENKNMDILKNTIASYDFLKEDKQKIIISFTNREQMMQDFNDAYNDAIYTRVKHTISHAQKDLLFTEFGYSDLPLEIGLYKYNYETFEWEKVAE